MKNVNKGAIPMEVVYKNPKIYLVGGKARSGKTVVGQMIKDEYEKTGKRAVVLSYAKYFKDYVKSYFGWDGSEATKPRDLLQQLGTDIIKEKLHMPLFHINRMIEDITVLSYFFDVIIVNDVRFKNEFDVPKEKFNNVIAIGIKRDNFDNGLTEAQKNHISETDLDDYRKYDYVIQNDGPTEHLRQDVLAIINKEEK
jgi:hypothetical protein